ncbi:MAG TPA: formate dehydrogenase subunit alpha [Dehalococcoidia bacterium]|nr:formate dehydrogenase subunit alpha [Dehalococcoidia bacterium]
MVVATEMQVSVDGRPVTVAESASVLDAVLAAGVDLPHLCKDPDMPAIGACRTCLVEVEGQRGLVAACALPARDGLSVSIAGELARRTRRTVLDLTLAMGDGDRAVVGAFGLNELAHHAQAHGLAAPTFAPRRQPHADTPDGSNPFFTLHMNDCILCGRCAVACDDVQHIGAIAMLGSERQTHVGAFADGPIGESNCTSCGQCVSVCPTGALLPKAGVPARPQTTHSTCPYCGVGCGVQVQVQGRQIVRVLDEPQNQSSDGMLCVKGRFGTTFVNHPDRLTTPLVRRAGVLQPASWDEALDLVAERLVENRGRFACFASAKATNEDGYVLQKFTRLLMGTNNIDHCTRLCHSPSVEAMLEQVGSGATSNSYQDYEDAGCVIVAGCDPSSNHPVVASRMRRAIDHEGVRLIVINPRRIDLCAKAEVWLRPLPGTDVALLNAMARVILDEGLADTAFIAERTEEFTAWRAAVESTPLTELAGICGVPLAEIQTAARLYASPHEYGGPAGRTGSCLVWGMGMTQHTNGTHNAYALINLALLAGQMGRVGNGISPLRGQNNVQGCGDAGCIPDALPGYQKYAEPVLAKFQASWGAPLPAEEGLRATEIVEGALTGEIRAMYIVGENPLLTEPNLHHAQEAIEKLDFLVVQDIFLHETAAVADVVLPATTFAEKDGTFTNSERRVQRVRQALPPLADSRPDWAISAELGRRVARRLGGDPAQFAWAHPAQIWDEMAALTPSLAGISYARLEAEGGIQWPCPSPDHPGTPRLYGESFPRGKGRFMPVRQDPPAAELPNRRFPLILNTGRILYHWHGGTLTRRVPGLLERAPVVQVALSPQDAATLEVADGERVTLSSRRGEIEAVAFITEAQRPGEVFVPFVQLEGAAANFLTNNVYDPTAKIPEYKVCAVRIDKAGAPAEWRHGRREVVATPGDG